MYKTYIYFEKLSD